MTRSTLSPLAAGMLVLGSALALAGPAAAAGDPQAGAAKAAPCQACHGADGNSSDPQYPVLAGQVPGYIAKQLADFKSRARDNAIMAGMVQALSAEDMADIDAYYAAQERAPKAIAEDQAEQARAGEKIYRGGYRPHEIAACMGCHGPAGHGIPPRFPKLSGQHAAYLEAQLLAFKSGARENEVMNPIAFLLSAEQIRNISLYLSALQ